MKSTLQNLTRRALGIAVIFSMLTITFNSHAYESELSDSERQELINLILDFYDELGTQIPSANKTYELLLTAPDDVIDSMIDGIDDPRAYMRSIRDYLVSRHASYPIDGEQDNILTATPRVGGVPFVTVIGYPPEYPDIADPNATVYLSLIQRLIAQDVRLLPSATAAELNVMRCDGPRYAERLNAVIIASATASVLAAACSGLSGIPIVENISCAAAAGAAGTLDALERELSICDFHEGYINAAEIEAAYENSKLILGQVNKIGSNIDVIESTIVNSVNSNVNNQFTSLNGSLTNFFNTMNNSLAALSTSVNSLFSTLNTYLDGQFAGLDSKADSIQSAIAAVSGQADGLGEQSVAIQSSLDDLHEKTDMLDGKVNVLDEKVDVLDDKVNTLDSKANVLDEKVNILDEKISRCEVQIAVDSQSLRTAQGNFQLFLLVTLYGNRVEVDDSRFWIDAMEATNPIVENLMTGVQRIELDKRLIPVGESVPLTVDVSVSDGDCSAISMIQRGNP